MTNLDEEARGYLDSVGFGLGSLEYQYFMVGTEFAKRYINQRVNENVNNEIQELRQEYKEGR